ncbi:hypothetical protein Pcinc_001843 [Petrolisthes cinctipes]|uniref:Uncharacterized protein n=1 Tax=Petrolisthes cinctipes TaxID=88211 RepID=A0AAE1L3J5_PETCI|nr:hypothetical protein Pcinc_001843 [Petrolisthes cinctipes]
MIAEWCLSSFQSYGVVGSSRVMEWLDLLTVFLCVISLTPDRVKIRWSEGPQLVACASDTIMAVGHGDGIAARSSFVTSAQRAWTRQAGR